MSAGVILCYVTKRDDVKIEVLLNKHLWVWLCLRLVCFFLSSVWIYSFVACRVDTCWRSKAAILRLWSWCYLIRSLAFLFLCHLAHARISPFFFFLCHLIISYISDFSFLHWVFQWSSCSVPHVFSWFLFLFWLWTADCCPRLIC